jgi:hypothetical protein
LLGWFPLDVLFVGIEAITGATAANVEELTTAQVFGQAESFNFLYGKFNFYSSCNALLRFRDEHITK